MQENGRASTPSCFRLWLSPSNHQFDTTRRGDAVVGPLGFVRLDETQVSAKMSSISLGLMMAHRYVGRWLLVSFASGVEKFYVGTYQVMDMGMMVRLVRSKNYGRYRLPRTFAGGGDIHGCILSGSSTSRGDHTTDETTL